MLQVVEQQPTPLDCSPLHQVQSSCEFWPCSVHLEWRLISPLLLRVISLLQTSCCRSMRCTNILLQEYALHLPA